MSTSAPPLRRWRRRTVRLRVRWRDGETIREDFATTLGAGGLFVDTAEPPPRDTRLLVSFALGDSVEAIEAPARVVFVHEPAGAAGRGKPGMGIEFTDASVVSRLARLLGDRPET